MIVSLEKCILLVCSAGASNAAMGEHTIRLSLVVCVRTFDDNTLLQAGILY
jgi:hypothetical protein